MNERHIQLYQNLKNLAATTEVFLTRTHKLDSSIYRVFDYRLARFSDFLLPDAREARGIMFEVDDQDNPIRLACWMPQKFFNLGELSNLNTLADALVKQGRLSPDVYERAKKRDTSKTD